MVADDMWNPAQVLCGRSFPLPAAVDQLDKRLQPTQDAEGGACDQTRAGSFDLERVALVDAVVRLVGFGRDRPESAGADHVESQRRDGASGGDPATAMGVPPPPGKQRAGMSI